MRRQYLPTYRTDREYESPLHEYRVAMGLTVRELSTYSGVNQSAICALANGSLSPLSERKTGILKQSARKLCDFFKVTPGDLFPRYICELDRKKTVIFAKFEDNFISDLYDNSDPYVNLVKSERRTALIRSINSLQIMERKFTCMYFFLGYSYREIATYYNVSVERVRQRIEKSLRKLRHPKHFDLRVLYYSL